MCQFFSFISDGQGSIKYFDYNQRLAKVKMRDGSDIESYDSHTSIATFYGLTGAKEDQWNKWEYNPFTDKLVLDNQNTADDRGAVAESLKRIDWNALCGDIESIRDLIAQVTIIPWFKNNGEIPDGVKLFETRAAARAAARDAARDAAGDAAGSAARDAAGDAAGSAAKAAAWDAVTLARLHVCGGLEIDAKHMEHMRKRWAVWESGYGVACDVNGVIYAYKKP